MFFSNFYLYLLSDCTAPSVEKGAPGQISTFFFIVHVPLNLLKATKPLKGKSVPLTTDSVQAVDFLYSAFCCNYISFLGLASPYVMSFVTEGDILRNKPSQITSLPSNPSEAEWERATNCQHKYHLK